MEPVFATRDAIKKAMKASGIGTAGSRAVTLLADIINEEIGRSQVKSMRDVHDRALAICERIAGIMRGLKRKKVTEADVILAIDMMRRKKSGERSWKGLNADGIYFSDKNEKTA